MNFEESATFLAEHKKQAQVALRVLFRSTLLDSSKQAELKGAILSMYPTLAEEGQVLREFSGELDTMANELEMLANTFFEHYEDSNSSTYVMESEVTATPTDYSNLLDDEIPHF